MKEDRFGIEFVAVISLHTWTIPCGTMVVKQPMNFSMLKQKTQDRVFDTTEEILVAIRKVWSEVTFEDLQSVFFDWIQ
jgi:hypothetical protein